MMNLMIFASAFFLLRAATCSVEAASANLRATHKSEETPKQQRNLVEGGVGDLSFKEYLKFHPKPSYWQNYRAHYENHEFKACAFLEFWGNMDPKTGDKCLGSQGGEDYWCGRGEQTCPSNVVPGSTKHPTKRCDCDVSSRTLTCEDWDPCYQPTGNITECPAAKPVGDAMMCGEALTCMYDEDHCCDNELANHDKNVVQCSCKPDEVFECKRLWSGHICASIECPREEENLIDAPAVVSCPDDPPQEGDSCAGIIGESCSYNEECCDDGRCYNTTFVRCEDDGTFGPVAMADINCPPPLLVLGGGDDQQSSTRERPTTEEEDISLIQARPSDEVYNEQPRDEGDPEEELLIDTPFEHVVCPLHPPSEDEPCGISMAGQSCSYHQDCCPDGTCHFTTFVRCGRDGKFGPMAMVDIQCRPPPLLLFEQHDDDTELLLPPAPIIVETREQEWIDPEKKTIWPELEGMTCQPDAVDAITEEDNDINIVYCIAIGSTVSPDFRRDRVRLFFDDREDSPNYGKVIGIPSVS